MYLVLKCMYFTLISTFNLTPSATGTTGRNGHKTSTALPTHMIGHSLSLFLASEMHKIVLIWGVIRCLHQPLRLVVLVIICYLWGVFCLPGVFSVFDFTVVVVSVLDLYLVSVLLVRIFHAFV